MAPDLSSCLALTIFWVYLGVCHSSQSQFLDQLGDLLLFLLLSDGRRETQRRWEGQVFSDGQSSHHHVVLQDRTPQLSKAKHQPQISDAFGYNLYQQHEFNLLCWSSSFKTINVTKTEGIEETVTAEGLFTSLQELSWKKTFRIRSLRFDLRPAGSTLDLHHPPAPHIQTDTWSLEAEELHQSGLLLKDLQDPFWLQGCPRIWRNTVLVKHLTSCGKCHPRTQNLKSMRR